MRLSNDTEFWKKNPKQTNESKTPISSTQEVAKLLAARSIFFLAQNFEAKGLGFFNACMYTCVCLFSSILFIF